MKAAILRLLRSNGIVCWSAAAGPYSTSGIPDILGAMPGGRLLAIEVKMPGKKPTKLQAARLADLVAAGANAWWTDNIEDVKNWIETWQQVTEMRLE